MLMDNVESPHDQFDQEKNSVAYSFQRDKIEVERLKLGKWRNQWSGDESEAIRANDSVLVSPIWRCDFQPRRPRELAEHSGSLLPPRSRLSTLDWSNFPWIPTFANCETLACSGRSDIFRRKLSNLAGTMFRNECSFHPGPNGPTGKQFSCPYSSE